MKIVTDYSGDYPDGPTVHINLKRFSDETDSDSVLFCGYNSLFNQTLREKYKNYSNKLLLNLWAPTEYNSLPPVLDGVTDYQFDGGYCDYFDTIYTICPYTIDWLKKETGTSKYKYIFHPFASPEDYGGGRLSFDKKYDVCYFGGLHGPQHFEMATILRNYNYRISYLQGDPYGFTTDINLSHHAKMQLAANSKISIVFNQVPLTVNNINFITKFKNWESNEAFQGISQNSNIMPQYKCRTAEAAYCRSVILVQHDSWNIIEDFFEKDEFVYFYDMADLKKKIDHILINYTDYEDMLNKAEQKAAKMNGLSTIKVIKKEEKYV